jgi:hypothetical protein
MFFDIARSCYVYNGNVASVLRWLKPREIIFVILDELSHLFCGHIKRKISVQYQVESREMDNCGLCCLGCLSSRMLSRVRIDGDPMDGWVIPFAVFPDEDVFTEYFPASRRPSGASVVT